MALSIRETCSTCLGETGTLSVYSDLFGYPFGRINRPLSVRDHMNRIRGQSINLCIFFVAHEPGFAGTFTSSQAVRAQHAIDITREIYAAENVGVRQIFWRSIGQASGAAFTTVDNPASEDLTDAFSGPNDGIDVFLVQSVTDADGWSNTDGPCDKDAKGQTGVVMQIEGLSSDDVTGVLMAHEVGHYLTLEHATSLSNVMGDDSDGDGVGEFNSSSRGLTAAQGSQMRASCWIRPACGGTVV